MPRRQNVSPEDIKELGAQLRFMITAAQDREEPPEAAAVQSGDGSSTPGE